MTIDTLEYFKSLVAEDDGLPLTETVLALAQDAYPNLDLQAVIVEIDKLASQLKRRLPRDAGTLQKLHICTHFFFKELGFKSDVQEYCDAENCYLNVVLRKRQGNMLILAVLYMELAAQIGLSVQALSFPGDFLLRVTTSAGEVILDPRSGRSLPKSKLISILALCVDAHPANTSAIDILHAFLRPASARELVTRILRYLKIIHLQTENWEGVLAVQKRLVVTLPDEVEERRDRGFAFEQIGRLRFALQDLESYLYMRPQAKDAKLIASHLITLRQRAEGEETSSNS